MTKREHPPQGYLHSERLVERWSVLPRLVGSHDSLTPEISVVSRDDVSHLSHAAGSKRRPEKRAHASWAQCLSVLRRGRWQQHRQQPAGDSGSDRDTEWHAAEYEQQPQIQSPQTPD